MKGGLSRKHRGGLQKKTKRGSHLDFLCRQIGYKNYEHYIREEHWKEFCEKEKRDHCYCCGAKDKLQVHHITYDNLGKELPIDVVTVCSGCHIKIHKACKSHKGLLTAHIKLRGAIQGQRKKEAAQANLEPLKDRHKITWVFITSLINKARHETIEDVVSYLTNKGLYDGIKSTQRARIAGLARINGYNEEWNLNLYISLRKADRKIEKRIKQGREPHWRDIKRSNLGFDEESDSEAHIP